MLWTTFVMSAKGYDVTTSTSETGVVITQTARRQFTMGETVLKAKSLREAQLEATGETPSNGSRELHPDTFKVWY